MAEGGSKQNVDPALVGTTKAKIACGLLCFAAFSHGVLLSWANPTIPQMELGKSHFLGGNYDDPLLKGSTNESLLASAHSIGAMIGALLSGPLLILANKIGRRWTHSGLLGLNTLVFAILIGLAQYQRDPATPWAAPVISFLCMLVKMNISATFVVAYIQVITTPK